MRLDEMRSTLEEVQAVRAFTGDSYDRAPPDDRICQMIDGICAVLDGLIARQRTTEEDRP